MGFGKLFGHKRSGPKRPDPSPKSEKQDTENDVKEDPLTEEGKSPPTHHDANTVHPFYDVKGTSFAPPLSIDASVLTEPRRSGSTAEEYRLTSQKPTSTKNDEHVEKITQDAEIVEIKVEDDKEKDASVLNECSVKNCTKENCTLENCQHPFARKQSLEGTISPTKLTEIINNSIKEAVQTIVKQCAMEDRKIPPSKEAERKPKEDDRSTICYIKNEAPIKIKREHRSRAAREQYDDHSKLSKPHDNARKSNFPPTQEKYDNVIRMNSTKFGDEGARMKSHHRTRENVCRNARAKKPSVSPNNVKTDNRRMTGNVNIYICSEATETTQANGQQKPKPQVCTKTSSDTATEDSNEICGRSSSTSSCKLVNNILKKRKKLQEQNSLGLLPEKEEVDSNSSDNNVCSCTSKRTERKGTLNSESNDLINAKNIPSEDVDIEKVESLPSMENGGCYRSSSFGSSDIRIENSDLSLQRSRLVVCDNPKSEGPWTTVYPAELVSDSFGSEDCLSKSACSKLDRSEGNQDTDYLLKNREPRNIWESDTEKILCDKNDDNDFYRLGNRRGINCNNKGHRKGICRTMTADNDWAKSGCRSNQTHPYKSNFKLGYDPSDRRTIACNNYREKLPTDSVSRIDWLPNSDCTNADKSVCKCREGNRDSVVICRKWAVRSNCKTTRKRFLKANQKDTLTQQWSICNCIAEEEEGGQCVDENDLGDKHLPEFSICRKSFEDIKGCSSRQTSSKKLQPDVLPTNSENFNRSHERGDKDMTETSYEDSKDLSHKNAEDEVKNIFEDSKQDNARTNKNATERNPKIEVENKPELNEKVDSGKSQTATANPGASFKFLNIENRLFKNIRKPRTKPEPSSPVIDKKPNTSDLPKSDITEPETKKNLRDIKLKPPSIRRTDNNAQNKLQQQSIAEDNKQKDPDKLEEGKSTEKGAKEKAEKTYQEKVKDSILYRTLKKIMDSIKQRNVQSTKSKGEGSASESISPDSDTIRKINDSKIGNKTDKLPARTKIAMKQKSHDEDKNVVVLPTSALDKEEDNKSIGHTIKGSSNKITMSGARPKLNETTNSENVAKDAKENVAINTDRGKSPKSKLLSALTSKRALTSSQKSTEKNTDHEFTGQSKQGEISQKIEVLKILEPPTSRGEKKEPEVQGVGSEAVHRETEKSIEPRRTIVHDITTAHDKITPKKMDIAKPTSSDVKNDALTICMSYAQHEKQKAPKSAASQWEDTTSFLASKCAISHYATYQESDDGFYDKNEVKTEAGCPCCHPAITTCYNEAAKPLKICTAKERDFPKIDGTRCGPPADLDCCRNWKNCECRKQVTCTDCYKSETEYRCNCMESCTKKNGFVCRKSMFCLYCDNPRARCICRAPVRMCSYCGLSMDLCRCQDQEIFDCNGRPVLTEHDNDRTIRVTAWKPRREVRRYFARNLEDLRADSNDDCRCHEKLKPHGSDDLPYQRLSVFSDVMNELQQKISESVCCTQCRRVPCCCNTKTDKSVECGETRARCFVSSPKAMRRTVTRDTEKPRSKSPNNYKRGICPVTNDAPRTMPVTRLCCACNAAPCRCRRNKSNQKKPRAKCYYCKSSPCLCITPREHSQPRPCRCADSPCRTKEKETTPCGKVSANPKNNDKKVICVR